jgi:hypothetical protein
MSEHIRIEREAARFLLAVADALSSVKNTATYGEFYVEEVRISFDGDETSYRVVPSDTGDYDIGVAIAENGDSGK